MISETPDICQIKHKEHNKQLYRTNQIGKVGTTTPKTHPKKTNKNIKKNTSKHTSFTIESEPEWTGTHVLDARHVRWPHIYTKKNAHKSKTANNLIAIWQPQFRKDNPSTKKPLSQLDRGRFQEVETLLLRNSIEAEAEAEAKEEEEDEVLFESYITNGTHPPAPPDR